VSAERSVLTSVDLDSGTAVVETEISLADLFGDDDRWVLLEDDHGWVGFEREQLGSGERVEYVDTRRPALNSRLSVEPRAVLEVARQRLVVIDPFQTLDERGGSP